MVLPEEPKQTAAREIVEEAPIELGHLHFAWHIPELRHPDVPALDVLAVLLGSGRSSRLFQQVRERQGLVHHVDAWTYSPGNPGLFGISAIVDADKFAAARDAILAEIEKMKSISVSADEVQKAAKQFISATLSTRKTMEGQAQRPRRKLARGEQSHFLGALPCRRQARHARRCPARRPRISHGGKPHALRAAAQRHVAEDCRGGGNEQRPADPEI